MKGKMTISVVKDIDIDIETIMIMSVTNNPEDIAVDLILPKEGIQKKKKMMKKMVMMLKKKNQPLKAISKRKIQC